MQRLAKPINPDGINQLLKNKKEEVSTSAIDYHSFIKMCPHDRMAIGVCFFWAKPKEKEESLLYHTASRLNAS